MHPILQVQLTGKGAGVLVLILLGVLAVLTGVWFLAGPGYAIAGGIGVVLLIRGVIALFKSHD